MLFFRLEVKNFGVYNIGTDRKFVSLLIKSIPIPLTTCSQCSVLHKVAHRPSVSIINSYVCNIAGVRQFVLNSRYIIVSVIVRAENFWYDLDGSVNGLGLFILRIL